MKKIVLFFVELSFYYIVAISTGFIMDKIWGIDMPLWELALYLTIGNGIYKIISKPMKTYIQRKKTN